MKRLFQALAIFVAIWVLGSFVGVMLDPARANIWTQSLMWAMLASVILAPVFIFVGTSPKSASQSSAPPQAEQPFEVDENVDVSQQQEEDAREREGWPYTT
jgi:NADH:ubiquinone oxidoreductase subunit 6 (subunit J)